MCQMCTPADTDLDHDFTVSFKKKLYGPLLWMGFNCLKATATTRRQFTFYHSNVQPNVQRYAFVYVNTVHLRGGMHTMGKVEGWRILRNEGILVIMQGFLY